MSHALLSAGQAYCTESVTANLIITASLMIRPLPRDGPDLDGQGRRFAGGKQGHRFAGRT
jgi:hypothetical protein